MADTNFTPQQIEQFLQEFFDVVGARQYVGARYVPIFGRAGEDTVEWDDGAPYEPLTVVLHQGVSYVSRRYVPSGIDIADSDYWAQTYRFNAQVEQYRQEVLQFQSQIDQIRDDMESDYVPFPDSDLYPKYGTQGQVLTTLSDGSTKWENPVVPSDEQAEAVITQWLDDHPEATTTVEDDSLTVAKFTPDLRNEIVGDGANVNAQYTFGLQGTITTLTLPTSGSNPIVFEGENNSAGNFGFITYKGTDYYCKLPSATWNVNIPLYSALCFSMVAWPHTVQVKTIANLDPWDVVLIGYAISPMSAQDIYVDSFTGVLYDRIMGRSNRNKLASIDRYAAANAGNINALYTFGLQGTITTLTLPTSGSNPIVFEGSNNIAGNFGFITYKGTDYYCRLPSSPWTVTIPLFSALVFSLEQPRAYVQVKTIANLDPWDVVLIGYAISPMSAQDIYVDSFTGVLYDRIMDRDERRKINSLLSMVSRNDDNVMRSICRFGESYGQPESASAISACHAAGFNIVRVNLQFTSDGHAVLWHDQYLNQNYHNVYDSSNTLVPYSESDRIGIADSTKSALDQYKYGGTQYSAGIPTLDAALKMCRKLGMEVVLECKAALDTTQLETLRALINRNGMMRKTSIASLTTSNATVIATAIPELRIGLQSSALDTATQDAYIALSSISDRLFWWGWSSLTLTSQIIDFCSQYGIEYECGDFSSTTAINTYLSGDYAWYCSGMEVQGSMSPLIGQYLSNV